MTSFIAYPNRNAIGIRQEELLRIILIEKTLWTSDLYQTYRITYKSTKSHVYAVVALALVQRINLLSKSSTILHSQGKLHITQSWRQKMNYLRVSPCSKESDSWMIIEVSKEKFSSLLIKTNNIPTSTAFIYDK